MKVADFLTDSEIKKVTEAVREAEKRTSGEIVPMVINRSDSYAGATWRIAVVVMLALAGLEVLLIPTLSIWTVLVLQIPGLLVGLAVGSVAWIERLAVHPKEMEEEVFQRAIQAFFYRNLHKTRDRTGVLVFVSLLERRVQILADSGISDKMKQSVWQETVDKLVVSIKNRQLGQGLVEAVSACGKILKNEFPIKPDDRNELSNELITLDV